MRRHRSPPSADRPPPHPATTTRRTWPTLERASTPLGPSACTSWRSSASSAPCPRWSSRSCPTGRRAAGRALCPRLVAVPLLLLSAASGCRRFRALRGRDALRTRAGPESYDEGELPGASGRLPQETKMLNQQPVRALIRAARARINDGSCSSSVCQIWSLCVPIILSRVTVPRRRFRFLDSIPSSPFSAFLRG